MPAFAGRSGLLPVPRHDFPRATIAGHSHGDYVDRDRGHPWCADAPGCPVHMPAGRKERIQMTIVLNHTIVPVKDKRASARFFADTFGLSYDTADDHAHQFTSTTR
jgi:hypothetical protein